MKPFSPEGEAVAGVHFVRAETVGFSWQVLLAFLRLTTRPSLFRRTLSIEAAFELMADWPE